MVVPGPDDTTTLEETSFGGSLPIYPSDRTLTYVEKREKKR